MDKEIYYQSFLHLEKDDFTGINDVENDQYKVINIGWSWIDEKLIINRVLGKIDDFNKPTIVIFNLQNKWEFMILSSKMNEINKAIDEFCLFANITNIILLDDDAWESIKLDKHLIYPKSDYSYYFNNYEIILEPKTQEKYFSCWFINYELKSKWFVKDLDTKQTYHVANIYTNHNRGKYDIMYNYNIDKKYKTILDKVLTYIDNHETNELNRIYAEYDTIINTEHLNNELNIFKFE